MKHASDMLHPLTDEFAKDLYCFGRDADLPDITGISGLRFEVWERALPEVREIFRARARRFMAGDISMLPWTWPVHTPSVMRVLPG